MNLPNMKKRNASITAKGADIPDIMEFTVSETGITEEEIKGKSRKRERVFARHLYCYLAKRYTLCSLKTIGEYIGDRDHTTVIHSNQSIMDLIDTDEDIADYVREMRLKISKKHKPYKIEQADYIYSIFEMGDGVLI